MDKSGDCQLSMEEFEAYVALRNTGENKEEIMKEFKTIDTNQDGYIQFLEFLR